MGLLWFSGQESRLSVMDDQPPFHKPRIQIAPGVFVVADKRAGEHWLEAFHILNTAFNRCRTDNRISGVTQDDDDHDS
jgi:hypothetical protein